MMRVVDEKWPKSGTDGDVHYDGCGLIGSHTLCGHTDIPGSSFQETTKRVTCRGCIAVRDHVLGRKPPHV